VPDNPQLLSGPRELTVPKGSVVKREGRGPLRLEGRFDRAPSSVTAVICHGGLAKHDHSFGDGVVLALAGWRPEAPLLIRSGVL